MATRRPRRVYEVGQEPDARFTLANERTLLSWLRTALALVVPAWRSWPWRMELIAQWRLVAGMTAVVFAPGQRYARACLIVPALLWGVMRSSLVVVSMQLLTVGLVTTAASLQGAGPFVLTATSALVTVSLVQLLIVTTSVVALGAGRRRR